MQLPENYRGMDVKYLELTGKRLAYEKVAGNPGAPGVLFLGGFRSDMSGTKAGAIATFAKQNCLSFVRFDYRGHGLSSGSFEEGSIGDWLQDALDIFDTLTEGKQIVVGSSMGGWIMLLLALRRKTRIAKLVGIASAPDFTEDLMWKQFTETQRQEILQKGVLFEPSEYGLPYPITRKLIEDGRDHLVMREEWDFDFPIHLLHGKKDKDVPYQCSLDIARKAGDKTQVTLIEAGDHRLNRPEDISQILQSISIE